jgi:hypothetical protein
LAEQGNLYNTFTQHQTSDRYDIYNCKHQPLISKGDTIGDHVDISLSQFLDQPTNFGPFFIPHFDAGPDLCFFVQLKLSNFVSRVRAIATTDPLSFYKSKNNKRAKKYTAEQKKCVDIIKKKYNGIHIGVVIVYPQVWKSEICSRVEGDSWIRYERVFDGRNQDGIFDSNHMEYLANIGVE